MTCKYVLFTDDLKIYFKTNSATAKHMISEVLQQKQRNITLLNDIAKSCGFIYELILMWPHPIL